jgi:hypothetical protein
MARTADNFRPKHAAMNAAAAYHRVIGSRHDLSARERSPIE